jgi:small subunit ribosomal protein S15
LTKHFAVHKKDKASQRGYQVLIAKRRSMLQYLRRKNVNEYNNIVQELGLKGQIKEL